MKSTTKGKMILFMVILNLSFIFILIPIKADEKYQLRFSDTSDFPLIYEYYLIDSDRYWSDNQVSITSTFKKDEADQIKHELECYEDKLKSVNFLPIKEHGYKQAPYEEISKKKYEEMVEKLKSLDLDEIKDRIIGEKFCDSDRCEIRF